MGAEALGADLGSGFGAGLTERAGTPRDAEGAFVDATGAGVGSAAWPAELGAVGGAIAVGRGEAADGAGLATASSVEIAREGS